MDTKSVEFEALGRTFKMRWGISAIEAAKKLEASPTDLRLIGEAIRLAITEGGKPIDRETFNQISADLGILWVMTTWKEACALAFPAQRKILE